MKICRFNDQRYGVVKDDQVYDVTALVEPMLPHPLKVKGDPLMANLAAIRAMLESTKLEGPTTPVQQAKFLSPIAFPTKILNAPVNYDLHIAESKADAGINFGRAPLTIGAAGLFLKANSALVGAGEGVSVRFPDRRTDHELELGIIVGKVADDVPEDKAFDYIGAYAIALDMTVRGTEDRSFRKSIDSYAVLGPWLVTADEMPNPLDEHFVLKVNGEKRQEASTKDMIYDIPTLIGWASRWYTLYPGDIIMSGTPSGVGPVGDGDVMNCSFDHIGSMDVKVRAHKTQSFGSAAREKSKG